MRFKFDFASIFHFCFRTIKQKTPRFIYLKTRGCGASQTIYKSSSPISPIWGLKEGHLLKYYPWLITATTRPLKNAPFHPISALRSDVNPRNIVYIPVVKILARLDLKRN